MAILHLLFFIFFCAVAEAVLCEVGEALKDPNNPSGADRVCGTGCPLNYACMQSNALTYGFVCCPARTYVCSLTPMAGTACFPSTQRSEKWFYDPTTAGCIPFIYNGCYGNLNNFPSKLECESVCRQTLGPTDPSSQLCPGSTPQPGTTTETPCNTTPFTVCQSGYGCQFSTALQRSYCCSITNNQFCPTGYAVAPGTSASSTCSTFTGCSIPGYSCLQSPTSGLFYCCAPVNFNSPTCPSGGRPLLITGSTNPVTCADGQGCPNPYFCQTTGTTGNGRTTGICCSTSGGTTYAGSQDCPAGMQPYRPNGQNVLCSFNNVIQPSICPAGTRCVMNLNPAMRNTFICCTPTSRKLSPRTRALGLNGTSVEPVTNKTTNKIESTELNGKQENNLETEKN